MKTIVTTVLTVYFSVMTSAQQVTVSKGKLDRIIEFQSQWVDSRKVDIWLPENYSPNQKYAVIYMHDGQMLFDPETTWNKQSWNVDETLSDLIKNQTIKPCIVVGIWNNGPKRHVEYFPEKAFNSLSVEEKKGVTEKLIEKGRTTATFEPISDRYLKFLVYELKPYIDSHYATNSEKDSTFIAGSSMGGLISLYAICEYPEIFGGAACLSTHWPGIFSIENNPIPQKFYEYLSQQLPNPKNHKIYFDYGDKTLDALYPELQKNVDKIMVEKGFDKKHWKTEFFPGKDHSEMAWAERFSIPIQFLLGL